MSDLEQVMEKLDSIESRITKLENQDSSQPDKYLNVWDSELDQPGTPEVATVVSTTKEKGKLSTGKVSGILGRSSERSRQVMRQLEDKHPRLYTKKKTYGKGRGLYLHYRRDN